MSRARDPQKLFDGAATGDILTLKRLKKEGFKYDMMDNDNSNALHFAAAGGNLENLQFLLQKSKLKPEQVNLKGFNLLHSALNGGHFIVAAWALEQVKAKRGSMYSLPVDALTKDGKNALHYWAASARPTDRAGMEAHEKCFELLLELGVNVNVVDGQGNSALLCAAENGNRSAVTMLMKNGADAKLANRQKENFIHAAVKGGNAHVVQVAVRVAGLSVQDKSHSAGTPLEMAKDDPDILRILLTSRTGTITRTSGAAAAAALAMGSSGEGFQTEESKLLKEQKKLVKDQKQINRETRSSVQQATMTMAVAATASAYAGYNAAATAASSYSAYGGAPYSPYVQPTAYSSYGQLPGGVPAAQQGYASPQMQSVQQQQQPSRLAAQAASLRGTSTSPSPSSPSARADEGDDSKKTKAQLLEEKRQRKLERQRIREERERKRAAKAAGSGGSGNNSPATERAVLGGAGVAQQQSSDLKKVVALYDFTPQAGQTTQLAFKKGDVLFVIKQASKDWLVAKQGDKTGLIPAPYVAEQQSQPVSTTPRVNAPAASNTAGQQSVDQFLAEPSTESNAPTAAENLYDLDTNTSLASTDVISVLSTATNTTGTTSLDDLLDQVGGLEEVASNDTDDGIHSGGVVPKTVADVQRRSNAVDAMSFLMDGEGAVSPRVDEDNAGAGGVYDLKIGTRGPIGTVVMKESPVVAAERAAAAAVVRGGANPAAKPSSSIVETDAMDFLNNDDDPSAAQPTQKTAADVYDMVLTTTTTATSSSTIEETSSCYDVALNTAASADIMSLLSQASEEGDQEDVEEIEAAVVEAIEKERSARLAKQAEFEAKSGDMGGWNARFQTSLAKAADSTLSEQDKVAVYTELSTLAQDFIHCVHTYGKIIISEIYTEPENKTVKPMSNMGFAGGDKYIVKQVLFKFAVDTNGLFDSDHAAMKVAGHELKGLISYFNLNMKDLHFPIMSLVDYLGFRVIAMSLLPVSKDTLIYGTADAAKTIHSDSVEFNSLMKKAAARLNLSAHRAGRPNTAGVMVWSAVDLEGHLGEDGRFYMLDFSRTFPPRRPDMSQKNCHLFHMLRPEFVRRYKKPLCSDGYSGFIMSFNGNAHNEELNQATTHLENVIIPKVAYELDHLTDEQLEHVRVNDFVHRFGINLRLLGAVRQQLSNKTVRKQLLIEMISRTCKQLLRQKMREKMAELKLPQTTPFNELVITEFNLLFGVSDQAKTHWNSQIRDHLYLNFAQPLSPEEQRDPLQTLIQIKDLQLLFVRLSEMLGLEWTKTCRLECESDSPPFTSASPFDITDLSAISPKVKHMGIVDQAEGSVLLHKAMQREGDARNRLLGMAAERFDAAARANPSDALSLRELAVIKTLTNETYVARDAFERSLAANPDDHVTLLHYAELLMRDDIVERDIELAQECLHRSLAAEPGQPNALSAYGKLLEKQQLLDESKILYAHLPTARLLEEQKPVDKASISALQKDLRQIDSNWKKGKDQREVDRQEQLDMVANKQEVKTIFQKRYNDSVQDLYNCTRALIAQTDKVLAFEPLLARHLTDAAQREHTSQTIFANLPDVLQLVKDISDAIKGVLKLVPAAKNLGVALLPCISKLSLLDVYASKMPKSQEMLEMYCKAGSPLESWATHTIVSRGKKTSLIVALLEPLHFAAALQPPIQEMINLCVQYPSDGAEEIESLSRCLAMLRRFERATHKLASTTHKFLRRDDANFADVQVEAALIDGCPFEVAEPGRILVMKGPLTVAGEKRFVFLFNDVCLITKAPKLSLTSGSKHSHKYQYHFPLNNTVVEVAGKDEKHGNRSFYIRTGEKRLAVLAKSSKAKFDWFSALQLQTEKLAHKTFGVPLSQLLQRDGLTMSSPPKVLSLMANHLMQEGSEQSYLFTLSPEQKRLVELRRVLESEGLHASSLQRFDCTEVAAALVDFILELPNDLVPLEPLMNALTGGDVLKSAALKSASITFEAKMLRQALSLQDGAEQSVTRLCVKLLHFFSTHSATISDLEKTLLARSFGSFLIESDSYASATQVDIITATMRGCVDHFDVLFLDSSPSGSSSSSWAASSPSKSRSSSSSSKSKSSSSGTLRSSRSKRSTHRKGKSSLLPSGKPSSWSVKDVCSWLAAVECSDAVDAFEENQISGADLFDLTDEELRDDLHIDDEQLRSQILEQRALLHHA